MAKTITGEVVKAEIMKHVVKLVKERDAARADRDFMADKLDEALSDLQSARDALDDTRDDLRDSEDEVFALRRILRRADREIEELCLDLRDADRDAKRLRGGSPAASVSESEELLDYEDHLELNEESDEEPVKKRCRFIVDSDED